MVSSMPFCHSILFCLIYKRSIKTILKKRQIDKCIHKWMRKRKSKGRKKQFARYVLRVNNRKIRHHVSGPSLLFNQSFTGLSAGIYLLKVNYRNTRTRYEICSKLTLKIPERRQWHRSGIFTVNFEHISHFVLVFLLINLNMWLLVFFLNFILIKDQTQTASTCSKPTMEISEQCVKNVQS